MKKYFAAFILLAIITICIFYFIIPSTKKTIYLTSTTATETSVSRQLSNKAKWPLWWPGKKINDTLYRFQDCNYRIEKILLNGFETTVFNSKDSIRGFIQYSSEGTDSTKFQWTASHNFSSNPLKRVNQYVQLNNIGNSIKSLLDSMKKYFDKQENVYGFKIEKNKVTESSLISVKNVFPHYPSTQEIYKIIESLKEYIKKENGEEAGYPMLHVEKIGAAAFETMVAIPTKTVLASKDLFHLKQMVLGGAILMAQVNGGVEKIKNGEAELNNYVIDYKKLSPAISFQSLVTNRLLETDSLKWITKLYYPVFE